MWMWALETDNTQQRESGQCGSGPWQLITLNKGKVVNLCTQYKKYWRLVTEATEEQKEGYYTVPHRC
jgi:hypothetical protein